MDDFIDAMANILEEANTNPETVTEAPFTQPVRRLDEVKAAKELDLVWSEYWRGFKGWLVITSAGAFSGAFLCAYAPSGYRY